LLKRLWAYRDLLVTLTRVQFRLRYRQSFMGLAWAALPPLATLGAGFLVFHRVADVQGNGSAYAVATMAALIPWTFFAHSLTLGVPAVVQAQPVVTRLPFSRAVLPLSMVGTSLIDLLVACGIFIAFTLAAGNGIPVTAAWFPVLLAIEIALIAGIALLGSAINTFARDIRLMVPIAVQLWLLVTPVMYPLSAVPRDLRSLYLLNPMTGIVESFRRVLVLGRGPELELVLPALVGAAIALMVGWWYFAATEGRFADVI
jgi:lipopolysaccharide transport system permease protein